MVPIRTNDPQKDVLHRIEVLETALQSIMDEAQKHFEWNPVGKVARLPAGYRKILNTAHAATNAL